MTNDESKRVRLRRFLRKLRDFYMDSMVNLDGKVGDHGGSRCVAAPPFSMPPPIFGSNWTNRCSSECLRDDQQMHRLNRSASERIPNSKVELERGHLVAGCHGVGRSYSMVGLGRVVAIDEDKCYDFDEEINLDSHSMYPRSRSYAAVYRRN